MPAVLQVYEEQGIKNGTPQNQMKGPRFPYGTGNRVSRLPPGRDQRNLTVEGMIKIVYDLLKDKLNLVKITFTSGVNAASAEFTTIMRSTAARCAALP